MHKDDKMAYVVKLMQNQYRLLGRIPKKQDFDSRTMCLIKQVLGPWPRALEAAGLKEVTGISSREKNRIKHKLIKAQQKQEKRTQCRGLNDN